MNERNPKTMTVLFDAAINVDVNIKDKYGLEADYQFIWDTGSTQTIMNYRELLTTSHRKLTQGKYGVITAETANNKKIVLTPYCITEFVLQSDVGRNTIKLTNVLVYSTPDENLSNLIGLNVILLFNNNIRARFAKETGKIVKMLKITQKNEDEQQQLLDVMQISEQLPMRINTLRV